MNLPEIEEVMNIPVTPRMIRTMIGTMIFASTAGVTELKVENAYASNPSISQLNTPALTSADSSRNPISQKITPRMRQITYWLTAPQSSLKDI